VGLDPLHTLDPPQLLRWLRHLSVNVPAQRDLRRMHIQPELNRHSGLDRSTLLT
jgi:hypothetical protein